MSIDPDEQLDAYNKVVAGSVHLRISDLLDPLTPAEKATALALVINYNEQYEDFDTELLQSLVALFRSGLRDLFSAGALTAKHKA